MTQFAFLSPEFPALLDPAKRAEAMALSDPRGACFYARLALETALGWMYRSDKGLRAPYDQTLAALIHEPSLERLTGPAIIAKAKFVKDQGNRAAHDARPVTAQSAAAAVRELFHICYWVARTYAKGAKPPAGLAFDPGRLEKTLTVSASTVAQIEKLRADHNARAEALRAAEAARMASDEGRAALEAEIARLRDEIAAVRRANESVPDTHDYDEATTRDAFIDLLLHEAGWPLAEARDREWPVAGMPNGTGAGRVDYVLWGDDGKPLALVEAKRTKKDPRIGQQQAKLYADALEAAFGRRPAIYFTNGYEHWFWDDAMYPPRPVQGFLKKDELALLHQRRGARRKLDDVEVDGRIAGRFYQARAIRRVGESFERDARRKALLVMATGSGKTRTVVALVDQLMRANWVRRVLFLADRVALVRQAHGVFKTHLPTAPSANLLERHDPKKNDTTGARVFLSTYPTMMNLIEEMQDGARRFGPGHFDLIVIDEAHRSVYAKYRTIFDYFDSLLVGLTATPRDEIDRDTYSLFQLERGVPTDSYDLEDAVADGFLVPPKAVSVPLKFQREGIRYDDLSEEEKEAWDALEWDEDGVIPDKVEAAGVNKWLFNEDTVDKVLEFLMRNGVKVEDGSRLGKTIIFAKNHRHADFIVRRFDAAYPHLKGTFARLIDNQVVGAQSLIDAFSEADKPPHIAVSVDMLDTGIDVPEVVNLVFFKIVRSKTKFWQMIGRGTRLRPDLFGPGEDKDHFLIFDFCQNFEFFDQHPDLSEGALGDSITRRLFVARVDLIGELDRQEAGATEGDLRASTAERLHQEVSAMSLDNFIVRPHRRAVDRFKATEAWQTLTDADRAELVEEVAGLPSAFVDDDLPAKQFDLLVLSSQLTLLRVEARFASLQRQIRRIASDLESLANIPAVGQQLSLILEIQTDEFWQDITPRMLDTVRVKLRDLVKLIEPGERKIVYTDFEDEIGGATEAPVGDAAVGIDAGRFRMKVRRFLEAHADHLALQKVRRAEQLTPSDVAELERMFLDEGIGDESRLDTIRRDGGLGLFFRSLLGLDRQAAKAAFSSLVDLGSLTASQIQFIDMIVNHLTERGVIDPELLYESPFTDVSDQGLSGVFPAERSVEVLEVVRRIRATAAA